MIKKPMQKTNQKKNQHKTSIAPSKTQKPLKSIRNNINNQEIINAFVDRFGLHICSKMAPQNDQKTIKSAQTNNAKKSEQRHQKRLEALSLIPRAGVSGLSPPPHSQPSILRRPCRGTMETKLPAALRKLRAAFRQPDLYSCERKAALPNYLLLLFVIDFIV